MAVQLIYKDIFNLYIVIRPSLSVRPVRGNHLGRWIGIEGDPKDNLKPSMRENIKEYNPAKNDKQCLISDNWL